MSVTREELAETYPDLLFCDGLDEALIGLSFRFGREPVALYDINKIYEIYKREGMTHVEAVEFFEFNVLGAWVGEYTPCFAELPTVERQSWVTSEETLRQIDAFFAEEKP